MLVPGDSDGMGLDDRDTIGQRSDSSQCAQGILHVVQHPQEKHYVEDPERLKIHRHEIIDHGFDLTVQGPMGGVVSGAACRVCQFGVSCPTALLARPRKLSREP